MNRIRIDDMDDDVILAEAEASSKELAEVAKAIVESSGNLIIVMIKSGTKKRAHIPLPLVQKQWVLGQKGSSTGGIKLF